MNLEEDKSLEFIGEKIGFLFGYFLFTTILFAILVLLNKIPQNWSYTHVMGITLLIVFAGASVRYILK